MTSETTYLPPRNALLRRIAEVGPGLPAEVEQRLRAGFFTATRPLILGAANSIVVALTAAFWLGDRAFLVIAGLDALLLALRVLALRRPGAPSDALFAMGLLWACLQGATASLVVFSGDLAMCLVVLGSSLGATGGIIGRNFPAPLYAMAQVVVIELCFKLSFAASYPKLAPLLACQVALYLLMCVSVVSRQRASAIGAITAEVESRRQALVDPLTGLANRRGLEVAFEAAPKGARTLFYLDLDGFKQVNDRLGHGAGDRLLQAAAERLRETAGPAAFACRLGGDEFLLLVEDLGEAEARALGARLVVALAVPYPLDGNIAARIGVSVGAVRSGSADASLDALMALADSALYAAKAAGKGQCIFHAGGGADAPNALATHAA